MIEDVSEKVLDDHIGISILDELRSLGQSSLAVSTLPLAPMPLLV
jgi:hypothetical protein